MVTRIKPGKNRFLHCALTAFFLTAPVVGLAPLPACAQGVITGNQTTTATVETIDTDTHMVLLRDKTGGLITLTMPPSAKSLPRLEPGDRISLRFFQTLSADIAAPGSSLPESTLSTAKGYARRHPHGTMVSFQRQRVKIVALDQTAHTVTFLDHTDITRTITLRQKTLQAALAGLKVGDEVDVTNMDAVSYSVLNRTVNGDVSVTEQNGKN